MSVSDRKMWFGTLPETSGVSARMGWVQAPDSGMDAGAEGYSEFLTFDNGGADVVSSAATHRVYAMDWSLSEASGATGLDTIKNYQQGLYGRGLIYFANPMIFSQNVLAPHWASPSLIEGGWPSIVNARKPTFGDSPSNNNDLPGRRATWDLTTLTTPVNTRPTSPRDIMTVVIPPEHTLALGMSGNYTGNGRVFVETVTRIGVRAITTLTPLSELGTTRMNVTYSGDTYSHINIFLGKSAAGNSMVTITNMMAQMFRNSMPITLSTKHIGGQGDTGCKFSTNAIIEKYVMVDPDGNPRHYKGMSVDLAEVGAWTK
jgi:hypothetical protein